MYIRVCILSFQVVSASMVNMVHLASESVSSSTFLCMIILYSIIFILGCFHCCTYTYRFLTVYSGRKFISLKVSTTAYWFFFSMEHAQSSLTLVNYTCTTVMHVSYLHACNSICTYVWNFINYWSAAADSCFGLIGPRQCSAALHVGGPAISTEVLRA